ncbi:MAG TPA: GntR family transcriptional regulator [Chloroflexia bacterium]|nr:GntR family transcriptional regulator [Chloroflexia bacterium]
MALPVENNTNKALAYLRHQIVTGALKPGERLIETEIATQLGTSRSPVREAIRALEQEGLVVHEPHRGAIVRTIGRDDIIDIYEMRMALDTLALRQASRQITPAHLEQLENYNNTMAQLALEGHYDRLFEPDFNFHKYIVQIGGSPRLKRAYDSLMTEMQNVISLSYSSQRLDVEMILGEHNIIIRGLKQGDLAKAEAADNYHLKLFCQAIVESYFKQL